MNVSRVWQYFFFSPVSWGESFDLDARGIREVHRVPVVEIVAVVALEVSREGVLARMG